MSNIAAMAKKSRRNEEGKLFTRPAASSGVADTESGIEGEAADDPQRALFALEALYRRGLIPEADYRARKAALEADLSGTG